MLIKQNTTPTITIQCTIDFINSGQLPASYQICKTGGTLVGGGGSVTNQGGLSTPGGKSCYAATVQLASGETDTFGDLLIQVLDATNLLMGSINCQVVAFDPTDATALGLAALPAAAAGASGGLHVLGANAGNVSYSGNLTYSGVVTLSAGLQITPGIWVHGNGAGGGNNVATVYLQGTSNNVPGLEIDGNGSGPSTVLLGGATGPGLKIDGGSTSGAGVVINTTSGDGIDIAPTAGHGLNISANGTSKHAALLTGGTAGTSDGLRCVAGTGGVDLRAAGITGNTAQSGDGYGFLTSALTESYAANGATATLAQLLYMIYSAIMQISISGTTMTLKKLDGSTGWGTVTLDSSTAPTSRTRAS